MELIWNETKNETLKKTRNLSFEMVEEAIARGSSMEIVNHPNHKKYPGQKVLFIEINGYMHFIPFVITGSGKYFLKTMFKSRKVNKRFSRRES